MAVNDRRDFLKSLGSAGAILSVAGQAGHASASPVSGRSDPDLSPDDAFPRHAALGGVRVDDPYAGVDWSTIRHIASATHLHVTSQARLDQVCDQMQLRHLPISNYYPSAPYYPLEDIRVNQFVHQDFGVVRNGRYQDGPVDWNRVITDPISGWAQDLPPESRRLLPLLVGERMFDNIPHDVIVSPNAEHHGFTDTPLHICAPGSLHGSGAFDVEQRFGLRAQGYELGAGLPWREVFQSVLDQLLFDDGGGVTINHPTWSRLDFDQVCRFLDFDSRVLGIEVYNDAGAAAFGDPTLGWAVELWDRILSSGRRCLGFFSPDKCAKGKNFLLVDQFTERECLKSYRTGAFYGSVNMPDFRFSRIELAGDRISVLVSKEDTPDSPLAPDSRLIANVTTNSGRRRINAQWNKPFQIEIPLDDRGRPMVTYIRIEAVDIAAGEVIYSQPIRFIGEPAT